MPNSPEVVTYGIVGVGMMGLEHIRNILCLDNTAITCIADNYPDSVKNCMSMLHSEHPTSADSVQIFSDAEDLFKANLCKLVVIATPNHTHHKLLLQAYKSIDPQTHVLVEKPLCTTISDCRDVIRVAEARPGITYVGLEYSYMPPITRIIRDARNGIIGAPLMVSIREHRFPFLVKVRDWNRLSKNSGGTFVEKCCHFFDLFNQIFYPHFPVSVYASGGQDNNHLDERYDDGPSDILDNGYVIVNYSQGKRACLDLCMFAEASHAQEEVCIVGPKGKLEAFLPQLEVRSGIRGKHACASVETEIVDDERIKYRGHHYGSSFLEHLDILEQVRKDSANGIVRSATAGLFQGFISVVLGIAAHMSIEQKREVKINELMTEKELQLSYSSVGLDSVSLHS